MKGKITKRVKKKITYWIKTSKNTAKPVLDEMLQVELLIFNLMNWEKEQQKQ